MGRYTSAAAPRAPSLRSRGLRSRRPHKSLHRRNREAAGLTTSHPPRKLYTFAKQIGALARRLSAT